MGILCYDPAKSKPRKDIDVPYHSVDVYIVDEDGLHGIAYYNFDLKRWDFVTDTLTDYDEIRWLWYYSPIDVKNIKWEEDGSNRN